MNKTEIKNGLHLFVRSNLEIIIMNFENKQISQENMYSGRILDVIHRRIQISQTNIIEYEVLHRPNIVVIIPILPSGDIILIRQFRSSIEEKIWEFPAGSIDVGESPIDAAKRELEEETGYAAGEIKLLQTFYTAPHFCDEKAFIFRVMTSTYSQPNLQEKEVITSHVFSLDQLMEKYNKGEIIDAKTVVAYHSLILSSIQT